MRSPFGRKLFRAFLLFALAPAIILVAVGYYLVLESSGSRQQSAAQEARDLLAYHNEMLFTRLNSTVEALSPDSGLTYGLPDFVFVWSLKAGNLLANEPPVPTDLAVVIVKSAARRPHGFVDFGGRLYQYASRAHGDSVLVCAVLGYDSAYSALAASFQEQYAATRSQAALQPRYAMFVLVLFVLLASTTAALAYLLSNRLSRNLAQPLQTLSEASQRIAVGEFKQSVPAAGTEEMRVLIDNFNRMAERLDATTQRLAQSERVAAWRQIARRFAHELKNPLQPILISLYRIEKSLTDSGGNPKLRDALQAASVEITHLTELANRFSQLAKLPPPRTDRVNVNELLTSIASLYRDLLAPYDFRLELPNSVVTISGDDTYLREVLHNLLQNAADASAPGSRITLALNGVGETVQVVVADHGHGMSGETAAAAPMPYFTTKDKGTGLGLAVVEKMVTEMGGSVRIVSREGSGTTVTVTFPREV